MSAAWGRVRLWRCCVFAIKRTGTPRTAVGIHEMPLDAPVQLVLWAEVE